MPAGGKYQGTPELLNVSLPELASRAGSVDEAAWLLHECFAFRVCRNTVTQWLRYPETSGARLYEDYLIAQKEGNATVSELAAAVNRGALSNFRLIALANREPFVNKPRTDLRDNGLKALLNVYCEAYARKAEPPEDVYKSIYNVRFGKSGRLEQDPRKPLELFRLAVAELGYKRQPPELAKLTRPGCGYNRLLLKSRLRADLAVSAPAEAPVLCRPVPGLYETNAGLAARYQGRTGKTIEKERNPNVASDIGYRRKKPAADGGGSDETSQRKASVDAGFCRGILASSGNPGVVAKLLQRIEMHLADYPEETSAYVPVLGALWFRSRHHARNMEVVARISLNGISASLAAAAPVLSAPASPQDQNASAAVSIFPASASSQNMTASSQNTTPSSQNTTVSPQNTPASVFKAAAMAQGTEAESELAALLMMSENLSPEQMAEVENWRAGFRLYPF